MTKEEILKIAKPILFNTEMVKAILRGQKTVTRRLIKCKYSNTELREVNGDILEVIKGAMPTSSYAFEIQPKFNVGDYLYVRETFCKADDGYHYAADRNIPSESEDLRKAYGYKYKPSIHMPKEAARIFIRITDVSYSKLHDITGVQILSEGVDNGSSNISMGMRWENQQRMAFEQLWDKTTSDSQYKWNANPFVWVYKFERVLIDE